MTGLKVIKPGVLATIQDWGRYGQRENGLSSGGPMDEHAFLWANRLLDNPANSSMIELTVGLSQFESIVNSTIAICGADMNLTINNKPALNWSTHPIKIGDKLKFNSAKNGLRAYLAIQNGFAVKPVFGSTSTVAREKIGGLSGQRLIENDLLPAKSGGNLNQQRRVPSSFIPEYTDTITLRFIPSYQYKLFEQSQQMAFVKNTFTVSQRMDRMGCRLEGEKIAYQGPGIVSEGIALGSIQIPPDGQPIILLKDSGSIGGYPKLGCVMRGDLNKLAQCRPGDKICFTAIDPDSAMLELREFQRFFNIN